MQQTNYYIPQEELDEELTIDLKKIFFILWSRKLLITKIFIAVLIFFIVLTFILPKKYKVDADLYINKSNNSNMAEINPYVISELGAGSGMTALMTGSGTLANDLEIMQSPLVIDNVIRENDLRVKKLYGFITTKKTGQYLTTEKFLKKGISFENKKGTNVVSIEYKNKDRELAYNVVASIVKNYIEVQKELNSEKSKSDKKIIEKGYNEAKNALEAKVNSTSGIPEQALASTGGLSAMSAFSSSAQKALSNLRGQIIAGEKSKIEVTEEAAKVAHLSSKLEWAKMVEEMSDSSKVVILKAPRLLEEYEQTSPKLFTDILLGVLMGIISSLIGVILAETFDKKLSYSMLGENIIYYIKNDLINLKTIILSNKDKNISFVIFEQIPTEVLESLKEFPSLNIIRGDISQEFVNKISNSSDICLFASINKTDAKLYKQIKQMLQKTGKKVLTEVLI